MILIDTEEAAVEFCRDYKEEVFRAVRIDQFRLGVPNRRDHDHSNPEHFTNLIIALQPVVPGGNPTPAVFTEPIGTYILASGLLEELGIHVEELTIADAQKWTIPPDAE